jgi:CRP-like cAMP-binding protein
MDFAKDNRDAFGYYAVRYWLKDFAFDDPTSSRVRARVYAALKRADIPLALPTQVQMVESHNESYSKRHAERESVANLVAIKTVGLFKTLSEAELVTLAQGLVHAPFANGEIMTRQGATAHWLYIMVTGRAEVRAKIDPDGDGPAPEITRAVATLTAPAYFGEMSLMTGEPRSADVVAAGEVDCYRLHRDTFEKVLLARPEIAEALSENIAARRVELIAAREGLDEAARKTREESERAKILNGIKSFFGL